MVHVCVVFNLDDLQNPERGVVGDVPGHNGSSAVRDQG
jgi:hypothetical protein